MDLSPKATRLVEALRSRRNRAVLAALAERRMNGEALTARLGKSQPTLSRAMNELYEAGLILRFSVRQQRPGRPLVEWALLTPHADEALRQLEVIAGELLAQQAREDSGQA